MNSFAVNAAVRNPGKINNSGGYAFFPGTGPVMKICNDCTFANKAGQHTTCRKWQDMKRSAKPGPAIDRHSDACKYFSIKGN